MKIKSHGEWVRYIPSSIPKEGVPDGVIWARRKSDDKDWYEYVRNKQNFGIKTVKFMAGPQSDGLIVGNAVFDQTMLFPAGCWVFEITDYVGTDPYGDFGNKIFDMTRSTFSDRKPYVPVDPLAPILKTMDEILKRLDKLEKK